MPSKELIDYFIQETNKRFDEVDRKLEQLIGFRWMLLGMSAAVSAIVGLIVAIYFGK